MTEANADLTQLIGSRICHDLISPIGAISNGVELLAMTAGNAPAPEELDLIESSARAATARIRLFRLAFGVAGSQDMVRASEFSGILADVTGGGRLEVNLDLSDDMPRIEGQLGCLAILCFESAMPRGGILSASWRPGRWQLCTEAETRRADPALWAMLTSGPNEADVTPAHVQFKLLSVQAAAAERRIKLDDGPDGLRMTL